MTMRPEIEGKQYILGDPLLTELFPRFVLQEVRRLAEFHDQDQQKVDDIPVLFATFDGCAELHCDVVKRFTVWNGKSHRIFQVYLGGSAYWMRCDTSYVTLFHIHGSVLPQWDEERIHECWVIRFPDWDGQVWEVYRVTIKAEHLMEEGCPTI